MKNFEGESQKHHNSSFEIPCSTFDIHFFAFFFPLLP